MPSLEEALKMKFDELDAALVEVRTRLDAAEEKIRTHEHPAKA